HRNACGVDALAPSATSMPSTRGTSLRREALTEGDQQLRRALDADAPAEQRPQEAPLLRQEAEPRLAVGGNTQVGLAPMTFPPLQGPFPDRDGRFHLFLAGEGEMVDGV